MHTRKIIKSGDFGFTVAGERATFDDVLPDLTVGDRIAIVANTPGGALAAAPLLLAAVGRYYELLTAERGDDFYRYPSYFVLHIGDLRGYHGWLDVWSEHADVVVAPHGEAVLEALHDRAITRVFLEANAGGSGELMREKANWFLENVSDVLMFEPGSRQGKVTVTASTAAAGLVEQACEASDGLVSAATAREIVTRRLEPQAFEPVAADEALRLLCGYGPPAPLLGQSADYLARHGADENVLANHRYPVA